MLTPGDSPTPSRGHTQGTASFSDPASMQGGIGRGCSALCQSFFPLQHLQLGLSTAPQGRAGQGGCNGGLVPTAIFPFPICAAKVAPASWAIVLTVCKKEIKTSLFGRHKQQRNNKKEKKNQNNNYKNPTTRRKYSSCS